jgi:hypothetical protein
MCEAGTGQLRPIGMCTARAHAARPAAASARVYGRHWHGPPQLARVTVTVSDSDSDVTSTARAARPSRPVRTAHTASAAAGVGPCVRPAPKGRGPTTVWPRTASGITHARWHGTVTAGWPSPIRDRARPPG